MKILLIIGSIIMIMTGFVVNACQESERKNKIYIDNLTKKCNENNGVITVIKAGEYKNFYCLKKDIFAYHDLELVDR